VDIVHEIVLPQAEIAEICRRFEVKELLIFGSAGRGEMRQDSDMDLLVEFIPGAKIGLSRHAAAEHEFSELLGRKVDLVSKPALRSALRNEVLAQAHLLYAA
jgi:uncharacterized protein